MCVQTWVALLFVPSSLPVVPFYLGGNSPFTCGMIDYFSSDIQLSDVRFSGLCQVF